MSSLSEPYLDRFIGMVAGQGASKRLSEKRIIDLFDILPESPESNDSRSNTPNSNSTDGTNVSQATTITSISDDSRGIAFRTTRVIINYGLTTPSHTRPLSLEYHPPTSDAVRIHETNDTPHVLPALHSWNHQSCFPAAALPQAQFTHHVTFPTLHEMKPEKFLYQPTSSRDSIERTVADPDNGYSDEPYLLGPFLHNRYSDFPKSGGAKSVLAPLAMREIYVEKGCSNSRYPHRPIKPSKARLGMQSEEKAANRIIFTSRGQFQHPQLMPAPLIYENDKPPPSAFDNKTIREDGKAHSLRVRKDPRRAILTFADPTTTSLRPVCYTAIKTQHIVQFENSSLTAQALAKPKEAITSHAILRLEANDKKRREEARSNKNPWGTEAWIMQQRERKLPTARKPRPLFTIGCSPEDEKSSPEDLIEGCSEDELDQILEDSTAVQQQNEEQTPAQQVEFIDPPGKREITPEDIERIKSFVNLSRKLSISSNGSDGSFYARPGIRVPGCILPFPKNKVDLEIRYRIRQNYLVAHPETQKKLVLLALGRAKHASMMTKAKSSGRLVRRPTFRRALTGPPGVKLRGKKVEAQIEEKTQPESYDCAVESESEEEEDNEWNPEWMVEKGR